MLRVGVYPNLGCADGVKPSSTLLGEVYIYQRGCHVMLCLFAQVFLGPQRQASKAWTSRFFYVGKLILLLKRQLSGVWLAHLFQTMKKLFILLCLCVSATVSYAQKEVVVRAGTLIPMQLVNATKAADVTEGQKVAFRVSRDVNVDGVTAIPYGTTAQGTVYEAKKNSWWGTKGRLGIKLTELYGPNGELIPLTNGDVYVTGKNKTPLSVCLSIFVAWPCCFIHGTKAQLPAGYEVQTTVAANTPVKIL